MDFSFIIDAVLSGIIQGATELLPVSSTGHLLLFSAVTGTTLALSDIAVLHLGTLGSILVAMREKLKILLIPQFWVAIAVAAVPAGIIGFLFEDCIDANLGSPGTIAFSLAFWGAGMIGIDRWSKDRSFKTDSLSKITLYQAAFVGLAQMLALIPGTSRSGITTMAGILSGMSPSTALAFSFISGIPLLAGSGLYGATKTFSDTSITGERIALIIVATIVAAIVGIGAAYILKSRIQKGILTICGIYRILLSIALVLTIV